MLHTFLNFELDEEQFELRSQGTVIATQARVFALIRYLLLHRERVISKDELTEALWDGAAVSDTAISQVVMLARKAVQDEGDRQEIIKTIRGRGFRFIAPVEAGSSPPSLPAPPNVRGPGPRLFGRAAELAELSRQLGHAEQGRGGLVLVGGEPGIGKTTLATAFAEHAQTRGADVLWGRAWEADGAPPFWPWIQVLRSLAQREGIERLRSALGNSVHELSPLLPELAGEPAAAGQDLDGPRARFRQFDAIARLLHSLAGPRRDTRVRVIILDDLHAVDDASLQLLRFLLPDLHELALLFVATFRDLELVPGSALGTLVDSCTGACSRLQLRGIDAQDAARLLERSLGRPLPERDGSALFALSNGNPLLLAALAHRLDASGHEGWLELSQLSAYALPDRIASAVRKHLVQLPETTRTLLSAASVFGREFPLRLLARLHGCSEPELLELLEPARRREILRPAALGDSHLAFAHALVCNAVYSELTPTRRLQLHRQIAELLEASFPPEQWPLYELAHHYCRAAADGCRAKAIELAGRAAAQAENMSAYEAAASLYERALALSQLEHTDTEAWHALACSAGGAWYRAGELERAAACYDRAAEIAHRDGNAERFAWAVVSCITAIRGSVLHDTARQLQLRQALGMLPPGDSPVRALALGVSMLGARGCSLDERRLATRSAVEMARRLGDSYVLQWTLNAQHLTLWGAAPPDEMLLDGMLWRMADCADGGNAEDAIRHTAEYTRTVEELGSPWHRYMALGSACYHVSCQGDFAHAATLSEQVRKLGLRVGESVAEGFYEVRRLFLQLHQGLDAAQALEAPASVPEQYRVFWALPAALSDTPAVARRTLHALLASDLDDTLLTALRHATLAVMAQVAVLLNEPAAIEQLYRLLLPDAGRAINLQAWVCLGSVSYHLGIMAAALGQPDRAREHFDSALSETAPSPVFQCYVQHAYGQLLLQTGETARARALLSAAQSTTAALGMRPLHQQVSAALAQRELGHPRHAKLMHN